MRSLFHFPLPCTTTLAVTVSYSNRPTAPEMSRRPHPAPMRRQRRSPVLLSAARPLPGPALTGPWPAVTRSQGARHAAPPSLPRAAARSHRAPSPEYRPAAPAPIGLASSASRPSRAVTRIASTSLRAAIRIPLCRHRADSALIAPHHDHRAPPPSYTCCASPSASRPPCADIRVTPPISLLALRRPQGPGWQEPRRMHPFFAECAKKASFLATSARNACFSRSRWQHPRPMHPFPGAIGRFRMHGARILPPRALFRVEEPEITHGAKMLPAPPSLSAAAACGMAEQALRHATAACGTRHGRTGLAPYGAGLACLPHAPLPSRPRSSPPSYMRRASPSETRHAVPVPMHLATCAPHPSRQPRGPTASRKQAEQRKQLNAGIKIGSPNGDPIEEFFGFAQRLPDALQPLHQANELALSYLDHSTRQRLGGYVIGLSGNSFTVDLYAALVDHATSIAR